MLRFGGKTASNVSKPTLKAQPFRLFTEDITEAPGNLAPVLCKSSLCTLRLSYTSCPPDKFRRSKELLEKSFTSIIVIKAWELSVGMRGPHKNE